MNEASRQGPWLPSAGACGGLNCWQMYLLESILPCAVRRQACKPISAASNEKPSSVLDDTNRSLLMQQSAATAEEEEARPGRIRPRGSGDPSKLNSICSISGPLTGNGWGRRVVWDDLLRFIVPSLIELT